MHLESADAFFHPSHTQMWKEYAPQKDTDIEVIEEADEEIEKADSAVLQEQFKNDMLKLQRDVAQIRRIAEYEENISRSNRTRKITHLREQNALGAREVQKYMSRQCVHIHHESPAFEEELVKVPGWGWVDPIINHTVRSMFGAVCVT